MQAVEYIQWVGQSPVRLALERSPSNSTLCISDHFSKLWYGHIMNFRTESPAVTQEMQGQGIPRLSRLVWREKIFKHTSTVQCVNYSLYVWLPRSHRLHKIQQVADNVGPVDITIAQSSSPDHPHQLVKTVPSGSLRVKWSIMNPD